MGWNELTRKWIKFGYLLKERGKYEEGFVTTEIGFRNRSNIPWNLRLNNKFPFICFCLGMR